MTAGPGVAEPFERVVLPFLDDAYTLARYLTRNEHDAQDIVQESFLRAIRYWGRHPVESPRAWLLTIVRRSCYAWHASHRIGNDAEEFNEAVHTADDHFTDTAAQVTTASEHAQLLAAIDTLPAEFREVLVLRELQELSYREISTVVNAPIGTVMSRLSRARLRLHTALGGHRP